jgi:hypothetical protein
MQELPDQNPWLFAEAMTRYRHAFGLFYDGESELLEAEECNATMEQEAFLDDYAERHNACMGLAKDNSI